MPDRTVVQTMRKWLPQSQAWLHAQLSALPPDVAWVVAPERTENVEQFPPRRLRRAALGDAAWDLLDQQARWARRALWTAMLRRTLRLERADVLHSHFGNQAWRDLPAARASGIRHVASFYGYDATLLPRTGPHWRERYADLFATVDLVLCEGPAMAQTVQALGCPAGKLRVHHLGVDPAAFPPKRRTWLPGTPLKVLLAGRFVAKKGFPDGLAALGRVHRQGIPVAVTVVGADDGSDRSIAEGQAIDRAITEAGLDGATDRVGLVPYVRLMEMMYDHHIFLAPSKVSPDGDSEGGAPVTLVDAAATGMPIVTTRHADIPHVLPPQYGRLLATEGDVAGIAAALRWWVDHPGQWEDLAAVARRRIEAEFDVRRQGSRLGALYHELASARKT